MAGRGARPHAGPPDGARGGAGCPVGGGSKRACPDAPGGMVGRPSLSRVPVHVRDAVEADAAALALLWSDLLNAPRVDVTESPATAARRGIVRAQEDASTR